MDCCVYKMKYYHAGMINRANSFSFSEISEASTAYYWYNLDISNALVIYLIFFISLAMMILAFFGNITGLLLDDPKSLVKLPLYEAFSTPLLFYFGIVAQITTSITALFDILLDYSSRRK